MISRAPSRTTVTPDHDDCPLPDTDGERFKPEDYKDWKFVVFQNDCGDGVNGWVRLFWLPRDSMNGNGFDFAVLRIVCRLDNDKQKQANDSWNCDEVWVEKSFHGAALWDGVRHIYMGNEKGDDFGYVFYPDLTEWLWVINQLQQLELKHCPGSSGAEAAAAHAAAVREQNPPV